MKSDIQGRGGERGKTRVKFEERREREIKQERVKFEGEKREREREREGGSQMRYDTVKLMNTSVERNVEGGITTVPLKESCSWPEDLMHHLPEVCPTKNKEKYKEKPIITLRRHNQILFLERKLGLEIEAESLTSFD